MRISVPSPFQDPAPSVPIGDGLFQFRSHFVPTACCPAPHVLSQQAAGTEVASSTSWSAWPAGVIIQTPDHTTGGRPFCWRVWGKAPGSMASASPKRSGRTWRVENGDARLERAAGLALAEELEVGRAPKDTLMSDFHSMVCEIGLKEFSGREAIRCQPRSSLSSSLNLW